MAPPPSSTSSHSQLRHLPPNLHTIQEYKDAVQKNIDIFWDWKRQIGTSLTKEQQNQSHDERYLASLRAAGLDGDPAWTGGNLGKREVLVSILPSIFTTPQPLLVSSDDVDAKNYESISGGNGAIIDCLSPSQMVFMRVCEQFGKWAQRDNAYFKGMVDADKGLVDMALYLHRQALTLKDPIRLAASQRVLQIVQMHAYDLGEKFPKEVREKVRESKTEIEKLGGMKEREVRERKERDKEEKERKGRERREKERREKEEIERREEEVRETERREREAEEQREREARKRERSEREGREKEIIVKDETRLAREAKRERREKKKERSKEKEEKREEKEKEKLKGKGKGKEKDKEKREGKDKDKGKGKDKAQDMDKRLGENLKRRKRESRMEIPNSSSPKHTGDDSDSDDEPLAKRIKRNNRIFSRESKDAIAGPSTSTSATHLVSPKPAPESLNQGLLRSPASRSSSALTELTTTTNTSVTAHPTPNPNPDASVEIPQIFTKPASDDSLSKSGVDMARSPAAENRKEFDISGLPKIPRTRNNSLSVSTTKSPTVASPNSVTNQLYPQPTQSPSSNAIGLGIGFGKGAMANRGLEPIFTDCFTNSPLATSTALPSASGVMSRKHTMEFDDRHQVGQPREGEKEEERQKDEGEVLMDLDNSGAPEHPPQSELDHNQPPIAIPSGEPPPPQTEDQEMQPPSQPAVEVVDMELPDESLQVEKEEPPKSPSPQLFRRPIYHLPPSPKPQERWKLPVTGTLLFSMAQPPLISPPASPPTIDNGPGIGFAEQKKDNKNMARFCVKRLVNEKQLETGKFINRWSFCMNAEECERVRMQEVAPPETTMDELPATVALLFKCEQPGQKWGEPMSLRLNRESFGHVLTGAIEPETLIDLSKVIKEGDNDLTLSRLSSVTLPSQVTVSIDFHVHFSYDWVLHQLTETSQERLRVLTKSLYDRCASEGKGPALGLLDPISKKRIELPVRGKECEHLLCFDLQVHYERNKRNGTWTCPMCGKESDPLNLERDEWVASVLKEQGLGKTRAKLSKINSFDSTTTTLQPPSINNSRLTSPNMTDSSTENPQSEFRSAQPHSATTSPTALRAQIDVEGGTRENLGSVERDGRQVGQEERELNRMEGLEVEEEEKPSIS